MHSGVNGSLSLADCLLNSGMYTDDFYHQQIMYWKSFQLCKSLFSFWEIAEFICKIV